MRPAALRQLERATPTNTRIGVAVAGYATHRAARAQARHHLATLQRLRRLHTTRIGVDGMVDGGEGGGWLGEKAACP
jgi:hypothetical protein